MPPFDIPPLSPQAQGLAREATSNLGTVDRFAYSGTGRRVLIFNLVNVLRPTPLGDHSHLMIENLGADIIQIGQSDQLVDWIGAGGSKTLDGDTELFIFLQSKTAAGTIVRLTLWGSGKDVIP